MAKKENNQSVLLRNGALGFAATFAFFTAGFATGMYDGYNEITTGITDNNDTLSKITDTLMIAGCMTGMFTAAVGTVYKNRQDQENNNNFDGPN